MTPRHTNTTPSPAHTPRVTPELNTHQPSESKPRLQPVGAVPSRSPAGELGASRGPHAQLSIHSAADPPRGKVTARHCAQSAGCARSAPALTRQKHTHPHRAPSAVPASPSTPQPGPQAPGTGGSRGGTRIPVLPGIPAPTLAQSPQLSPFPRFKLEYARAHGNPAPCLSASRAGTRAPSPGRAGRRPQAGGSVAAAGTGAPSVGRGPGARRARGLRRPVLPAAPPLWAREQRERVLLESGGGEGRGQDARGIPPAPGAQWQVPWRQPGARYLPQFCCSPSPATSWDLLAAPGSPIREPEGSRTQPVPLQRGPLQDSFWGSPEARD